jgi:hypothetical protein
MTSESWINDNKTVLTMGNVSAASQVAIYGDDLYVGGSSADGFAGFWKNGVFSAVSTNEAINSQALGIALVIPNQ